MGNQKHERERREEKIELLPSAINEEIKIWESIKSCKYSEKSIVFFRTIDVNNILNQLYKAKTDNKLVEMKTKPLYIYYYSEEEKRKAEEEIRKLEEERRKREEERKNLGQEKNNEGI